MCVPSVAVSVLRVLLAPTLVQNTGRETTSRLCVIVWLVSILVWIHLAGIIIHIPLDGDLPRSRKVNVTLDEEAVRTERIRQLKNTRSGFRSLLTKKRNELSELLHREKNVDTVKMKIMELDQAFVNFKGAHNVYTKSLVEESSITESLEYFESEHYAVKELKERAESRISELLFTLTPSAQVDILPENSISQIGSGIRSRASIVRSKSSRSSSSTSSTRLKYVEEAAKRKALEAKLKVFEEQQALAEKKFQLQQQEEVLKIKSDLAQTEPENKCMLTQTTLRVEVRLK